MHKFYRKHLLVISILATLFITNDNLAQGRNSVYLETGFIEQYVIKSITYDYLLAQSKSDGRVDYFISTNVRFGIGDNGDGLDVRYQERFYTMGLHTGILIDNDNRFEIGLQRYVRAERDGYLGIDSNDPWSYDYSIRTMIGFRHEVDRFLFRLYAYPERDDGTLLLWPSVGIGYRF